ncbi:MAG TPA: hypothetical protein VI818_01550 [Candidatus Thermoplasmatota archaeon]|nr:hypothetical protein [Candidatus Thermoplasmatota archaeon]
MLVWMVALVACLEALGPTVIALYRGATFEALVWMTLTLLILAVASSIEKVKLFLET